MRTIAIPKQYAPAPQCRKKCAASCTHRPAGPGFKGPRYQQPLSNPTSGCVPRPSTGSTYLWACSGDRSCHPRLRPARIKPRTPPAFAADAAAAQPPPCAAQALPFSCCCCWLPLLVVCCSRCSRRLKSSTIIARPSRSGTCSRQWKRWHVARVRTTPSCTMGAVKGCVVATSLL